MIRGSCFVAIADLDFLVIFLLFFVQTYSNFMFAVEVEKKSKLLAAISVELIRTK